MPQRVITESKTPRLTSLGHGNAKRLGRLFYLSRRVLQLRVDDVERLILSQLGIGHCGLLYFGGCPRVGGGPEGDRLFASGSLYPLLRIDRIELDCPGFVGRPLYSFSHLRGEHLFGEEAVRELLCVGVKGGRREAVDDVSVCNLEAGQDERTLPVSIRAQFNDNIFQCAFAVNPIRLRFENIPNIESLPWCGENPCDSLRTSESMLSISDIMREIGTFQGASWALSGGYQKMK